MCEHGHIENLKQVGRNTQQRAATICEQTALQYYEKCLLSRVAMLCMVFKTISKYTRDQIIADNHSRDDEARMTNLAVNGDDDDMDHEDSAEEEIHVACNSDGGSDDRITTKGPYFRISFDYFDDGECSKVRMQWLKKKGGTPIADQRGKTSHSNYIMDGLRAQLHNYNGGIAHQRIVCIDGISETTVTKNKEPVIVRAVPSYRKGCAWNDWITINWEEAGKIPAKVLVILDYDTCTFEQMADSTTLSSNNMAVIATPHEERKGIHIVVHSASYAAIPKKLRKPFQTKLAKYYLMEKNVFQMVNVDQIVSRVFTIADDVDTVTNAVPISIIVVQDKTQWSDFFFDYSEYLDGSNLVLDFPPIFTWEELE